MPMLDQGPMVPGGPPMRLIGDKADVRPEKPREDKRD